MKNKLLFFSCLFLMASFCFALDPTKNVNQYRYDNWIAREVNYQNIQTGLPTSTVFDIVQDYNGYMWIASETGLLRFDGVHFKLFNYKNTPEIWRQGIYLVEVGKDSSLWIASNNLIRYKNNKFKVYSIPNFDNLNFLTCIFIDSKDNVWIGVDKGGLCKVEGDSLRWIIKNDRPAHKMIEDDDGALIVGFGNSAVFSIIKEGVITNIPYPEIAKRPIFPSGLFKEKDGSILFSLNNDLYKFKSNKFEKIKFNENFVEISSILKDRDGNLWIGSNYGFYRYYQGKIQKVTNKFLPGEVSDLLEDKDGNIWVATRFYGLTRIKETSVMTYGKDHGLRSDRVEYIYKDYDETVWIGTREGLYHFKDNVFKGYFVQDGLNSNYITSIFRDKSKKLWVGTNKGVHLLNGNKFVQMYKDSIDNFRIDAITQDDNGIIYFGSLRSRLFFVEKNRVKNFFQHYKIKPDETRVMLNDGENGIWIGGQRGLYNLKNNTIKLFTTKEGLGRNSVRDIFKSSDGVLWIGTMWGGVTRYKNGKFYTYNSDNGLKNDAVIQINEDDDGNMWFGSKSGFFYINKKQFDDLDDGVIKNLSYKFLDYFDGLQMNESSNTTHYKSWSNKHTPLWLVVPIGASVYKGYRNKESKYTALYIDDIFLDAKPVNNFRNLTIAAGTSKVEFRYNGINLTEGENLRYRYFLEGFDKEWMDAGKNKVAVYTNIPPGNYQFKVEVININDNKKINPITLSLRMEPHFYQTIWFYGFLFICLLAGIYGLIQLRIRHLKLKEIELKNKVDEAVAQIKVLSGLVPICANCKQVRDDKGYWTQVEAYIQDRSEAKFSHSVCPACAEKLYPQYYKKTQK